MNSSTIYFIWGFSSDQKVDALLLHIQKFDIQKNSNFNRMQWARQMIKFLDGRNIIMKIQILRADFLTA